MPNIKTAPPSLGMTVLDMSYNRVDLDHDYLEAWKEFTHSSFNGSRNLSYLKKIEWCKIQHWSSYNCISELIEQLFFPTPVNWYDTSNTPFTIHKYSSNNTYLKVEQRGANKNEEIFIFIFHSHFLWVHFCMSI